MRMCVCVCLCVCVCVGVDMSATQWNSCAVTLWFSLILAQLLIPDLVGGFGDLVLCVFTLYITHCILYSL